MLKFWPFYFFILSTFDLKATEWNFKNNPFFKASKIIETKLDLLPQSFELSNLMISDWLWPLNEGGILHRWAQKNPKNENEKFSFQFFSYENLKNVDISQLSPPEKFDLYLGNTNWTFSRFIKNSQMNLVDGDFKRQLAFSETILKFKNPDPVILEGKSSFKIPFGSSDIKALLFASILLGPESNTKIVGAPCKYAFNETPINKIQPILEECEGINPGSFHLILSNYLGLRGEGISLDLKRDKNLEIRPVIGYVSNFQEIEGPVSSSASKMAKKEILVTTFIKFIRPQLPLWFSEPNSKSRGYESFTYTLELDQENNIIGGSWISFNRPDFIAINKKIKFQNNFNNLDLVYNKSIGLLDEKLKLKSFTQKEFIKEAIYQTKPQEILNLMFDEYFESYKKQLIEKKIEKKIARSKMSRELSLGKKELLKKIRLISINKPLKNLSLKFIELAELNRNGNEINDIQKNFLDLVRANFVKFDMVNAGRLAYLQQKYIDDFLEFGKNEYNRLEYIQRSILMESQIFSKQPILTSTPLFLKRINLFIQGSRKEKDNLKANPLGVLRLKKIMPKVKPSSSSVIVAEFIKDVKKDLNKFKSSNLNYWKRFLSEQKTINRDKIIFPNNSEEIKRYNSPRNYKTFKKMYRLSFSIKRIQALKKVQTIPTYNVQKEKTEHYQLKFQEELGLFKFKDFFKPLSTLESISLYPIPVFKSPILSRETAYLLDKKNKEVEIYNENGKNLVFAIRKNNSKTMEELLKNNLLLNFESDERLNPLLIAVSEGNKMIIDKILSNDLSVSINYEDQMGKNALTLGITKNLDQNILKLMVYKGIDFNAKDNLGLYPRDYLKRTDSFDQYLESLGAKLSHRNHN